MLQTPAAYITLHSEQCLNFGVLFLSEPIAGLAETLRTALKLHQSGDLEAAGRLYQKVLHEDPKQPDAWHLLGLVALARGDFETALAAISRAIQIDGGQASFHHHLAEVFLARGQRDEARRCLEQAVRVQPLYAAAH